jgi:hydroxypyruvate isomerase
MTLQLAANVDLLYTEAGEVPARIAAAADAGFTAVEMWTTSDRDVDEIHRVASDRGVAITAMIAEPRTNITFPDTPLEVYYDGVSRTVERAIRLGCPRIIASGGTGYMRMKRPAQLDLVAEIYSEIIARTEGSGIEFVLENFNARVDHPGCLLDRTRETVETARKVRSERFGVLYDLYHSMVEGEDPAAELAAGGDLIRYLQLADVPGRGEPGSGNVDWPALFETVRASGFDGTIGLEFYPTRATPDALRYLLSVFSG